jgi:hypothetical protein
MKSIEKSKHTHLIESLRELRTLTTDLEETARIDREIEMLTDIYDNYRALMDSLHAHAARYNSLCPAIQYSAYCRLRITRRAATTNRIGNYRFTAVDARA